MGENPRGSKRVFPPALGSEVMTLTTPDQKKEPTIAVGPLPFRISHTALAYAAIHLRDFIVFHAFFAANRARSDLAALLLLLVVVVFMMSRFGGIRAWFVLASNL